MSSPISALAAGAIAGTCVDLTFFPIDTLKTRLQARGGFFANGGWHGVYKGVGSTIVASAPGAALFFVTYEQVKYRVARADVLPAHIAEPGAHMLAAICGETAACAFRVPSEVIKQRVQTLQYASSLSALQTILRQGGLAGALRTLYTGYGITLMREIPFTAVQFPLYEQLKKATRTSEHPYTAAICGCIAGGTAAALTTPLDVIKTRLMTHNAEAGAGLAAVVRQLRSEGAAAFFKGVVPRTLWISAGGAVFLGVYETAHSALQQRSGAAR